MAEVEANPNEMQARFDYAEEIYEAGQAEEAVEQILIMYRADGDWNESEARNQLYNIIDELKPKDRVVLNGRRKLSSILFA